MLGREAADDASACYILLLYVLKCLPAHLSSLEDAYATYGMSCFFYILLIWKIVIIS